MSETKNAVVLQRKIENPLYEQTDWSCHSDIVVGVHRAYTYNEIDVRGLVEIIQPSDPVTSLKDFRDIDEDASIVTTTAGARALAALLIEVADAVDKTTSAPTTDAIAQRDAALAECERLREALRKCDCPSPVDGNDTIQACVKAGTCGCSARSALTVESDNAR